MSLVCILKFPSDFYSRRTPEDRMQGRIALRRSYHGSIWHRRSLLFSSLLAKNYSFHQRGSLGNTFRTQNNRKRRFANISYFHTTSSSGLQSATAVLSQDQDDDDEILEEHLNSDNYSYNNSELQKEISYNDKEDVTLSRRNNDNLRSRDKELDNDGEWELEKDSSGGLPSYKGGSMPEFGNNDNVDNRSFDNITPSVMEMLRNFDPVQPPTSGDPEELQLWLECYSQRETVLRHQDLLKKARDRKAFDSMSLMQRHVVQWFQGLRDAIEIRQKEFLSNQDKRRASNRYGPFLCSLHPDKMAVILSQEAIVQALLNSGKDGKDGIALVKIALAIGAAVETEVVSQRRMKERFHKKLSSSSSDDDNEDVSDDGNNEKQDEKLDEAANGTEFSMDRWSFSASHLKFFLDDLQRLGMGKTKRAVRFAMERAKQAMDNSETWTTDDLTHLGAALLSILTEHAKVNENGRDEPAFRVEKRWSNKGSKSTSFITIHDRIHKIFLEDEYLSWAANTTRHMPMIVPPSNWTGPNTGGYRWLEVDMMRTHRSNVQKEALQHSDLSIVCDGLNILGKTPWKINKKILEVGEYCWDNNTPIGDIPSRTDFEVPPEPIYPSSAYDPDMYTNKDDPVMKEKINAMQSYRDSTTKYHRVLQKNMVRFLFFCRLSQLKLLALIETLMFSFHFSNQF